MIVTLAVIVAALLALGALLFVLRRRGGAGVRGHVERKAQQRGQSDGWAAGSVYRQNSGPQ